MNMHLERPSRENNRGIAEAWGTSTSLDVTDLERGLLPEGAGRVHKATCR
jgi:hypothetical protein